MTYYPVWRFRGDDGRIVRTEDEDAAARADGFLPADIEDEEADPIPDVEIEEPKRRGRPRKS